MANLIRVSREQDQPERTRSYFMKGGRGMFRQSQKERWAGVLLLMFLFLGSSMVQAQDYPTKPVTLIVPMGAGGSHDLTARAVTSVARGLFGATDDRSAQTGRRWSDRLRIRGQGGARRLHLVNGSPGTELDPSGGRRSVERSGRFRGSVPHQLQSDLYRYPTRCTLQDLQGDDRMGKGQPGQGGLRKRRPLGTFRPAMENDCKGDRHHTPRSSLMMGAAQP